MKTTAVASIQDFKRKYGTRTLGMLVGKLVLLAPEFPAESVLAKALGEATVDLEAALNSVELDEEAPEHEADAWIEKLWLGKQVRQVKGITGVSGVPDYVGRVGNVAETFWDENGALHCLVSAPEGCWWCPASLLAHTGVVPSQ